MTAKKVASVVMNEGMWKIISRGAAIISPIAILGIGISAGAWVREIDARFTSLEISFESHQNNTDDHVPLAETIETFVTRREWAEGREDTRRQLQDIKDSARRTEDRVEKIYDLLRNGK